MKLSMNWLAEFVDVSDVDIKDYCDRLTATGSKVEGYECLADDISGVVVGKILSVDPHPDADRLVVCRVDIGRSEPIQVVTAAKNVFVGAMVPVATDGAHLPGGVKIKRGKLRGALSEGMFCSIAELSLTLHDMPGAVEDGILILGDCGVDAAVGSDIKEVLGLSDKVVEFEITSNRPDCLSVIGLARESAISFERKLSLHTPELKNVHDGDEIGNYLSVDVKAPELCPRYTAKVVKNVKIAPSPLWLRMRLRASGVRPINNIVDITNYVMLEYAQPMHAFDYSCLDGKHIVVRKAEASEEFMSLDDKPHVLDSSMLVISDEKKAVALAGVMGGANSEIKDDTKTVVFESANFVGGNVRVSARKLGMRTESSARFEKGLDPENTLPALERACELVEMLGAGEVVDGLIDVYPGKAPARTIKLDPNRINGFLGGNIPSSFMHDTLTALEFKHISDGVYEIPSFRADIESMNDLAEEIQRIYGYDKLNSTLPSAAVTRGGRTYEQNLKNKIAAALLGLGFDEIQTFSFISPKYYDKIRLAEDDARRSSVVISNPLGEDTSVMRTSALPSMCEILSGNYNMKNLSVKLYEAATVYIPTSDGELPEEKQIFTLGMYGDPSRDGRSFYSMKGSINAMLASLGITDVKYVACDSERAYHPGRCAKLYSADKYIGIMGELHPETADNYGIELPVMCAELNFDEIAELAAIEASYKPLPKFPALERDISVVCDEKIEVGELEDIISCAGGAAVSAVKLFDIYRGAQIGADKKSVSFAIALRAQDHTMTDEEAGKTMTKILRELAEKANAELRK